MIKSCKKIDALLGKQYFYGIISGRNDLLAYGCDVYASRKIIQTEDDRRAWLVNDLTQNLASFKYIQDSDINQ